jgi:hypothetical protein
MREVLPAVSAHPSSQAFRTALAAHAGTPEKWKPSVIGGALVACG